MLVKDAWPQAGEISARHGAIYTTLQEIIRKDAHVRFRHRAPACRGMLSSHTISPSSYSAHKVVYSSDAGNSCLDIPASSIALGPEPQITPSRS